MPYSNYEPLKALLKMPNLTITCIPKDEDYFSHTCKVKDLSLEVIKKYEKFIFIDICLVVGQYTQWEILEILK